MMKCSFELSILNWDWWWFLFKHNHCRVFSIIVWIGVTKYDLNLSWLLVGTSYLSINYNSWRPLDWYILLQRCFDLLVVETNFYKFDVVKMTEEKKLVEWSIFLFKICIYLAVRSLKCDIPNWGKNKRRAILWDTCLHRNIIN